LPGNYELSCVRRRSRSLPHKCLKICPISPWPVEIRANLPGTLKVIEPRTGPLLRRAESEPELMIHRYGNVLRSVLFLYMMRWPHSLQRIGSLDFISFFAPQSTSAMRERLVANLHSESYQHIYIPCLPGALGYTLPLPLLGWHLFRFVVGSWYVMVAI
jgi:hypothetical protein